MIFRPLEDMTVGQRIALTFAIVLAILFALALFGYLGGRWEAEAQDFYDDKTLVELDKKALDEAYSLQAQRLFAVWLAHQAGDTTRITNGLRIARRAYNQAALQIARREQQLQR